jgi:hypothetical protein
MRKEVKILGIFLVMLIALAPMTSATISTVKEVKPHCLLSTNQLQTSENTELLCQIGQQRITKVMPVETIKTIIELGKSEKNAFLTIYNKYSTKEEVDNAFEEIQPFFNALVSNGLTDKSVDELNTLFHNIREMIQKPKSNPFGPHTLGGWNGVPTPIFGNGACGIFGMDVPAIGFALGTHTILPTIGIDLLVTWAGDGETVTIGLTGVTTSTGPEFGLVIGFIGILLATPIMITGLLFQVGFAGVYVGVGPAPF